MPEEKQAPGGQAEHDFLRVLPDPNICRTRPMGRITLYAVCLVDSPFTCRYATDYGAGYLCENPHWTDFREK
jgi:hypothetical protein